MKITEAFRRGIELLKTAGNEAPAIDAGVLLCHVLNCDRAYLYSHGTYELNELLFMKYASMLDKRARGVPLQYLTGVQEFMSLLFEVGQGVLIPRQDTEVLVEAVIKLCSEKGGVSDILDIGTGSGCIAVSLAHYLPECRLTAVDKMPDALEVAKRNAVANGVKDRIKFVESDLFDGIIVNKYDFIVSNPPYIRTEDINGLQTEVKGFEPVEALDGGMDGLDFYRVITAKAPYFLKNNGVLAFETGYDQAVEVSQIMSENFKEIKIYKDLSGIDRVVTGRLRIITKN